MTPLERINDPNAVLNLFILFEVAMFVGAVLGAFIRSLVTDQGLVDSFMYQMLWIWLPVAALIAITGIVMFRRAERVTTGSHPSSSPGDGAQDTGPER
ncbi:hypothetical protein [Microbacterium karelineae]|uniref:hypothetical protein n=1 Tax=Microbacterium karelineae TaxID=2654283 RepID=UPI0012EAD32A|nr:hypothetical protein [Microbacterium karelineae]